MKKVLSIFLAVVLSITTASVAFGANYNGFVYQENTDGTYTITGYNDFRTELVNIPAQINGVNVTAIGNSAFQSKNNIQTVRIPETITSIGSMAFYGCKKLTSVVIGDKVTTIGSKAFNSCTSITEINLKNVELLGEYAFYGCTSLEKIFLGTSLKAIGKNAFNKCAALTEIKMSDTLLYIDDYAFAGVGITSVEFPDKLGYIGNSAFKGCSALSSVTFGTGDLKIANYAFENCVTLTEITIPDNVIEIGRCAFALREANSNEFTHNIKINCGMTGAAIIYAKVHGISVTVNGTEQDFENFGDIDGDGAVTTNDARRLLRINARLEPTPDEDIIFICDMNCNGKIDTYDIKAVLKIASGLV